MLGLVGVDMASSSAVVATAPVGEPHRHEPGRTGHGDLSHVQVRRHGSNSGALRSYFHRVPAAAAATRRASGGGDETVNNRRDPGRLLFGNPVSAVGDDTAGHVPAPGFS